MTQLTRVWTCSHVAKRSHSRIELSKDSYPSLDVQPYHHEPPLFDHVIGAGGIHLRQPLCCTICFFFPSFKVIYQSQYRCHLRHHLLSLRPEASNESFSFFLLNSVESLRPSQAIRHTVTPSPQGFGEFLPSREVAPQPRGQSSSGRLRTDLSGGAAGRSGRATGHTGSGRHVRLDSTHCFGQDPMV